MCSRRKWAVILALALILALAGLFAVLRPWNPGVEQSTLEAEVIYLACGHRGARRPVDRAIRAMLARSKSGVSIEGWKIVSRQGRSMRVLYKDSRACPTCRGARFLGITSNGFVAVFSGTPANPGSPLAMTKIRADDLPEPELLDLQRGIPFMTEKERLQILEGLTALLHE